MNTSPKRHSTGGKKRGKKFKKYTEKELINEYYYETSHYNLKEQKTMYENIHHLSQNEKDLFEKKFAVPKTRSQEIYASMLRNKNKKIIIATGPAGTGKTMFATEFGVRNFLLGKCDKLIFTRPSVSVDEDLGYLPGTLEEKMAPWVRPIYDILYQFISPKEVTELLEEKVIEIAPLGYMRGRTFKNCWIVADEMQNSTVSQMKMLLTRLGTGSYMAVTGDLAQTDRIKDNGLLDFIQCYSTHSGSSRLAMTSFSHVDIERHRAVREVLEIYGDV